MRPWRPDTGLCIFCAFARPRVLRRDLLNTNSRYLSVVRRTASRTTSGRRARGELKTSRNDASPNVSSTVAVKKLGKSASTMLRKTAVEKNPNLLWVQVRQTFELMKSRLTTKSFMGDGTLRQSSLMDPGLMHWATFVKRVRSAFDPTREEQITGEEPLEALTISECRDAYVYNSSVRLRNALTDAYVHHILTKNGVEESKNIGKLLETMRYPTEWFSLTRTMQRQVHLHVGPTNSGKTYNALKRLGEAKNGFYAGPLRLLAHEVYSRLNAEGVPCGLVTGDEVRGMDEFPRVTSHTVEMMPLEQIVDVAVIDEIQMCADTERGWAWTMGLLGARAKELHLCGEERVVPLVKEIVASMGDTLHIHKYERLNPLKSMSTSIRGDLKNLRKGDCVVCFSVLGLHTMKKEIEEATGRNCAIVYGSLPPEIRVQQARLFNDPDSTYDYLVASDAIGMGLNLSIKRIIFDSIYKYNGRDVVSLDVPHLKQIAGRAGRYRPPKEDAAESSGSSGAEEVASQPPQSIGLVTTMKEQDLPFVQQVMEKTPSPLVAAGIKPPLEIVSTFGAHFPQNTPYSYIYGRLFNILSTHSRYFLCNLGEQTENARAIDGIEGLNASELYLFTSAPAQVNDPNSMAVYREMARCMVSHNKGGLLNLQSIPLEVLEKPVVGEKKYLEELLQLHRGLSLYIWLAYRFADVFESIVLAQHAKHLTEVNLDGAMQKLSRDPYVRAELHRRDQRTREKLSGSQDEILQETPASEDEIGSIESPLAEPEQWADRQQPQPELLMKRTPTAEARV